MSTVGQIIRKARQDADWTQEALARAIGCSKAQLSLMESGQRSVSLARAKRVEKALKIKDGRIAAAVGWEQTPRDLQKRLEAREALAQRLQTAARRGESLDALFRSGELRALVEAGMANVEAPLPVGRPIPVINKVAAGYPREFTDLDYPTSVADEYVACPDVHDPQAFAARVVGDSMEPVYRAGEIVVFSPSEMVKDGCDCFVRLMRDHESTFKRVYFEDNGRRIRLQPLNSKYAPSVVDREDVDGMYAAVYVMRRLGTRGTGRI